MLANRLDQSGQAIRSCGSGRSYSRPPRPKSMIFLIASTCLSIWMGLCLPLVARAAEGGGGNKQEEKKRTRWTLEEWLAQKDRNRLMDQWLMMNTSANDYEFFVAADTGQYSTETESSGGTSGAGATVSAGEAASQEAAGNRLRAAGYATLIGLDGSYEWNNEAYTAWTGQLALRLLGSAVQNTNLTLFYGMKNWDFKNLDSDPFADESGAAADAADASPLSESFRLQTAAAELSLYLFKHAGVYGSYRFYFPAKNDAQVELSGTRTEAGAFIDFAALRVYGFWFAEPLKLKSAQTVAVDRSGVNFGIQLFF